MKLRFFLLAFFIINIAFTSHFDKLTCIENWSTSPIPINVSPVPQQTNIVLGVNAKQFFSVKFWDVDDKTTHSCQSNPSASTTVEELALHTDWAQTKSSDIEKVYIRGKSKNDRSRIFKTSKG